MKNKPALSKLLTGGLTLFFLAAVVFSFGIFLTGCDNNVTSLEDINTQEEVNFFDLPYDPVELAKRTDVEVNEVLTYTAFISAVDGGVILLDELEAAETFDGIERLDAVNESSQTLDAFVIQPNSFESDSWFVFQITKMVTVDGDMPMVFDCEPDGLVFSKPAILLINAFEDFGKKTEAVQFYYYNETTHKWELLDEQQPDSNGLVAFNVYHFSRYGMEGSGGTGNPPPGKGDDPNDPQE